MKSAAEAIKEKSTELIGPFYFNPVTLLCVIAQIQLAARHPKNDGQSKELAELTARHMQAELIKVVPEIEFIAEAGWNPDFDI